jgi:ParB/RepB/Spo0J family partition protein
VNANASANVVEIPVGRVRPMRGQPRVHFDRESIRLLAESIREAGQVVPAKVCEVRGDPDATHELIDGERRWTACKLAGVATLKAEVVDEPDPERRYLLSVIANAAREGHTPTETARVCERLTRTMTAEAAARAMGRSVAYVYQHLSILKLHPDLRDAMEPAVPRDRRLLMTVACQLARLRHHEQRQAWAKILAAREGSSRAIPLATIAQAVLAGEEVGGGPAAAGRPPGSGPGTARPHDYRRDFERKASRVRLQLAREEPATLRAAAARWPSRAREAAAADLEAAAALASALAAAVRGGGPARGGG